MAEPKYIGMITIVVDNRLVAAVDVQKILTEHGDIIIGRFGVPHRSEGLYVISVILDGEAADIDKLAAALSTLDGIHVGKALVEGVTV